MLAAAGNGLRKVLERAQEGDLFAIALLIACATPLFYVAWLIISALIPTPRTSTWRRWRFVGLTSLVGAIGCMIALWIWGQFAAQAPFWWSLVISLVFQLTVGLTAYSARKCREARSMNNQESSETTANQ